MDGYLGQKPVDLKDTPYADYTPSDWALYFIGSYGQIDGAHHKQWVLDQVARILKGTPVIVEKASWENGEEEYRIWTSDKPSQAYDEWVDEMRGAYFQEGDDEFDNWGIDREYGYDIGIAP